MQQPMPVWCECDFSLKEKSLDAVNWWRSWSLSFGNCVTTKTWKTDLENLILDDEQVTGGGKPESTGL